MQRDKKLGLALGVLLIGIVGAFFFRHDSKLLRHFPRLKNAQKLDRRIAKKRLTPYLTGVETENVSQMLPRATQMSRTPSAPLWQTPSFLRPAGDQRFDPLAQSPTAPDPIPLRTNTNAAIPVPEHNKAWKPSSENQPLRVKSPRLDRPRTVQRHRVKKGDTLSALATRYLGSGTRFRDLFEANREILNDPNDLRVGMELVIPDANAIATFPKPRFTTASRRLIEPKPASADTTDFSYPFGPPIEVPTPPAAADPATEKPSGAWIPAVRSIFRPVSLPTMTVKPTSAPKPKRVLSQSPPAILLNAD